MLKISEIYHKYINQDPIKIFQDSAIKAAIIFFIFLAIATISDFNKNLIVLIVLYIINFAASILMGSIEARRRAFFGYLILSILIINISPYVHTIFENYFMLIILVIFVGFWMRKFGEAFAFFPVMILVLACVSFIRYPLGIENHKYFTISALIIGLAFYILVINSYKIMQVEDIKKISKNSFKFFVRHYNDTFEKSRFRRFTQTRIIEASNIKLKNIQSLKIHGVMFLRKAKQDKWRYFCHNLVMLNRLITKLILNYKSLNVNHMRLGFDNIEEVEHLSQDFEEIFKKTLILILYIQAKNSLLENRLSEIEYLKYKFEMNYIEKYKNDKKKKKILFDIVLLLDDMFINIDNIKEAYDDLIQG